MLELPFHMGTRLRRVRLGLLAVSFLAPASAMAQQDGGGRQANLMDQVFSKQKVASLCVKDGGRKVVDKIRLANALTLLADASIDNIDINKDSALSDSEFIAYVSQVRRFDQDAQHNQVRSALATFFFLKTDPKYKGIPNYTIDPPPPPGTPADDLIRSYFETNNYKIVCGAKKKGQGGGAPEESSKETGDSPKDVTKNLLLRKNVKDLKTAKSKLKSANAAQFSYSDDFEDDKRSIFVEGVIGYQIDGDNYDREARIADFDVSAGAAITWYSLIPYLYVKSLDQSPNTAKAKDLLLYQPGLSYTQSYISVSDSTGFAFDLQVDANANLDAKQDSTEYTAGVRIEPTFKVGNHFLFTDPLRVGPLSMRPEIALLAREYYIEDAGTNPELTGRASYTSVGYEATLYFFMLQDIPVLNNLKGQLSYIEMENIGDIVDIRTFSAGLSYSPPGQDNITLEMNYVNGRDVNTLENQDKFTTGLGVRF